MGRPSLATLPIEIIENISWRGGCIFGLRAACRELQDKTWHIFRERYLVKRQIWIQRDSLVRLYEISCNARVAPLVRKVVISLHGFHKSYLEELETGGPLKSENNAYRSQYEDQQLIMHSGLAVEMLAGALQQLPCCEEITIHWNGEWEDFKPEEDKIAEADVVWALSNSMRRLREVIGLPPAITQNENDCRSHLTAVWCILLGALIKSRNLPLRTLAITGPKNACLPADAFACLSVSQLRELRPSFCNIQNLVLAVDSVATATCSKWDADFSTFLSAFENLSSLTLEFPPGHLKPLSTVLDVLPTFAQLKHLSLVNAQFRAGDLLEFLKRHRHVLKEMDLYGVGLVRGDWRDFLAEVGGELSLDRLRVCSIHQDGYQLTFRRFCTQDYNTAKATLDTEEWFNGESDWGFIAEKRTFAQDLHKAISCIGLSCIPDVMQGEHFPFNVNSYAEYT
jgi:hypothetical protein